MSHALQLKQEEAEKSRLAEIEYKKSLKEKEVVVAAKQEYQARRAENIKQEAENQKVCDEMPSLPGDDNNSNAAENRRMGDSS